MGANPSLAHPCYFPSQRDEHEQVYHHSLTQASCHMSVVVGQVIQIGAHQP